MIKDKNELEYYLKCDEIALQIHNRSIYSKLLDPIYKYQKIMRKLDYYKNGAKWNKIAYFLYFLKYRKLGIRLGFSIPCDRIGPGLCLAHYGSIVISQYAQIGANCKIHSSVNIGATGGAKKAPIIGNNVYIGPGAKLIGDIRITDDIVIGANAVVVRSIEEKGTYGGVPAKRISGNDSSNHLVKATEKINYLGEGDQT